eukprot:SAG11_NODE_1797_length_4246_cov_2.922354_4_plen_151_part_00
MTKSSLRRLVAAARSCLAPKALVTGLWASLTLQKQGLASRREAAWRKHTRACASTQRHRCAGVLSSQCEAPVQRFISSILFMPKEAFTKPCSFFIIFLVSIIAHQNDNKTELPMIVVTRQDMVDKPKLRDLFFKAIKAQPHRHQSAMTAA